MKLLIAVVALAVLASAEYQIKTREDLIKYRDKCVSKHGISQEEMEKYKKWNFPDDDNAHVYIECILKEFQLYDSEKGMNVEDIHKQIAGGAHADHKDDTHAKIEKCAKKASEAEPKKRAYVGAMCMLEEHLHLIQRSVHAHDHDHSQH